jgi:hypothetical protein
MGYDLHVERRSRWTGRRRKIPLEDWIASVDATEGVRPFAGAEHSFTNPKTGEVISWRARPGDAEVLCGLDGWRHVFDFFEGRATFRARGVSLGDPSDPIWAAAVALARRLSAIVCGDDGERYDLDTGEQRKP